ncbi:SLAP domain-containing protein [Companilactobacillus furfuricola]|uniref:SLAP domain-containing protein n=1 Tax=Companilactobacillus furfuricola TaxID=1462575 RepID=UPI000F79079D|nr:SLAP domain-containing protein [Companilactobacillus furfuricola]
MKKESFFIAGTALLATAIFFTTGNTVDASGIATTKANGHIAQLYQNDGSLATRGLAPNTPWAVGETILLNNETYYQVSTNEYVAASDVNYVVGNNDNVTVTVRTYSAPVFSDETNMQSGSSLPYNTSYKVNRIVTNQYGFTFYQVSEHGWVQALTVNANGTPGNNEHIDDFNPMKYSKWTASADENRDVLVAQGADEYLVSQVPDEFLEMAGTVTNLQGGDAGGFYRMVQDSYKINY